MKLALLGLCVLPCESYLVVAAQPQLRGRATPMMMTGGSSDKKGGWLSGITKWFSGADKEEETQLARRRRESQRTRDAAIDTMLEDAGIFGALMSPLVKGVAGAMADVFAEQQDDVDAVLSQLDSMLQRDSRVTASVGSRIAAGTPMSTGYSSINMNGRVQKQLSLVVPVTGSAGSGTAQVQAVLDGSGKISDMQARFRGPGIGRDIDLTPGGQFGTTPDDPDVIDV